MDDVIEVEEGEVHTIVLAVTLERVTRIMNVGNELSPSHGIRTTLCTDEKIELCPTAEDAVRRWRRAKVEASWGEEFKTVKSMEIG